jgi:hypothetical protein
MRDPTVRLSPEIEEAVECAQCLLAPALDPEHPWMHSEGRKRLFKNLVEILSSRDPEWLLQRNASFRRPGRRPNKGRDSNISIVVATIANEYGLRPTRHRGSERNVSASFVVATALARLRCDNLTEAAVEKIWQRASKHDRSPLPAGSEGRYVVPPYVVLRVAEE